MVLKANQFCYSGVKIQPTFTNLALKTDLKEIKALGCGTLLKSNFGNQTNGNTEWLKDMTGSRIPAIKVCSVLFFVRVTNETLLK